MRPPWLDDHGLADMALDVYAMGESVVTEPVKVGSAPPVRIPKAAPVKPQVGASDLRLSRLADAWSGAVVAGVREGRASVRS